MESKSDITYDEIGGVRAFAYGKKSIVFRQIDSTEGDLYHSPSFDCYVRGIRRITRDNARLHSAMYFRELR